MKNFYAPTSDFAQLISELQSYCDSNPEVISSGAIEVTASMLEAIPALSDISDPSGITAKEICWISQQPGMFANVVKIKNNTLFALISGYQGGLISFYDINPNAAVEERTDGPGPYSACSYSDAAIIETIPMDASLFIREGSGMTMNIPGFSGSPVIYSCIMFNEDISSLFVD